jgi:hypothetical protein
MDFSTAHYLRGGHKGLAASPPQNANGAESTPSTAELIQLMFNEHLKLVDRVMTMEATVATVQDVVLRLEDTVERSLQQQPPPSPDGMEKRLLRAITEVAGKVGSLEDDVSGLRNALGQCALAANLRPTVAAMLNTHRCACADRIDALFAALDVDSQTAVVQHGMATVGQVPRSDDDGSRGALLMQSRPLRAMLAEIDALKAQLANISSTIPAVPNSKPALGNSSLGASQSWRLPGGARHGPSVSGMELSTQLTTLGVRVTQVMQSSLAYLAGLRPGDTIVSCNHVEVANYSELMKLVSVALPGSKLRLGRIQPGRSYPDIVEVVLGS